MEKRVKQLSIGADEMDRRQSAARRLNRNANNRLRQQHEQFRDNHEVIAVEIDQKMKKIQNELNGIREISGYGAYSARSCSGEETRDSARYHIKSNGKRTKKQRRTTTTTRSKDITETISSRKRTAQVREIPVMDSNGKFDETSSSMSMAASGGDNSPRHLDTGHTTNYVPKSQTTSSTRRVTRVTFKGKEKKLPHLVTNTTSDSRSLLELDVGEARTQARKRILGDAEIKVENNTNEESQAASVVDDVESYMYVPPDGRRRTVYLMPPLEDLLKEARKARYLRMPKRPDDAEDTERELSVDEIFS